MSNTNKDKDKEQTTQTTGSVVVTNASTAAKSSTEKVVIKDFLTAKGIPENRHKGIQAHLKQKLTAEMNTDELEKSLWQYAFGANRIAGGI